MIKLNKKAQGLPLNTVVLAILVILVLVIVIVYFTTNMSKTGDSLDQNTEGVNACRLGSYIIPADKYENPVETKSLEPGCDTNQVRIYSAKTKEGEICCATLKSKTP